MVLIGIDPHTGSTPRSPSTATRRRSASCGCAPRRRSAVSCWRGLQRSRNDGGRSSRLGYPLAQQLVAAAEDVVDVPPMLSSRVRVLGSGKAQKNDPNDALSTAIAALRGRRLRRVELDDHVAIIRMLANRHHNVVALHTQAVCRLHAMLANLVLAGYPGL